MSARSEPADVAGEQLLSLIARVERLHAAKADIESDLKELFAEARGNGYDTKALKTVIRRRAADHDKVAEHEAIVDLYEAAIHRAETAAVQPPARTHVRVARVAQKSKVSGPGAGVSDDRLMMPDETRGDLSHAQEASHEVAPELPVIGQQPAAGEGEAPVDPVRPAIVPTQAIPVSVPFVEPEMPAFLRRNHPDCYVNRAPAVVVVSDAIR